jgi:hypothetical protein
MDQEEIKVPEFSKKFELGKYKYSKILFNNNFFEQQPNFIVKYSTCIAR